MSKEILMSETYQPKRRPIDPSILAAPAEPQAEASPAPHPVVTETAPPIMPQPEAAGLQITGNVPPALQKALSAKKTNVNQGPQVRPNIMVPEKTAKLEEILRSIQDKTTLYDEVTLPSLGRFYDGEDGPIDGKLHIRPMTGEEEQILATPRFVKRGQAINMIFNRCLQEKLDAEKFITPDRTYLLIYLRGISYTQDYDVELKCPHCDRKFSTTIDLNSLYVENCPDDFGPHKLNDVLPTTGLHFSYRLSNGQDERRIQEHRDRKLKGGYDTAGQSDDTLIYRTSLMIEDIQGLTDKLEIEALLKKLPINDLAYLRTVVNEPPFGVETTVEVSCSGCLADFEIELPLEASFFFPKARRKTQIPPA